MFFSSRIHFRKYSRRLVVVCVCAKSMVCDRLERHIKQVTEFCTWTLTPRMTCDFAISAHANLQSGRANGDHDLTGYTCASADTAPCLPPGILVQISRDCQLMR